MKRMFVTTVLIGVMAVLNLMASAVQAAPEPGTPKGKEHYSSRPKNYTPPTMLGPTVIEGPAPQMTIETDAAIPAPILHRAPEPPVTKMSVPTWTAAAPNQSIQAPRPVEPKPEPIVINENSQGAPISSLGIPTPTRKPLPVEIAAKKELPKDEDDTAVLNFVPRKAETKTAEPKPEEIDRPVREGSYWTAIRTAPAVEPVNDLDEFNGRLAKIQLEKHNLAETLALIEKIKSPNFKVKTLVDLAEYVSRDVNYKREADTLYALAVDGIAALDAGKPVVVTMPAKVTTPTKAQPKPAPTYVPPKKTVPTLIEEEKPAAPVKAAPVEEPKLAPEPKAEPKPEAPKPEPKPTDTPVEAPKPAAPTRTPILLDSLDSDVEPKNEAAPKTEMPSLPKLAPTLPEKTEAAPTGRRPNILLTEEPKKDEPKTTPAVEKPEGPKKTKLLPPEEIEEEAEKTEPAPKPKSTKRPMPGKRVVLEDN